MLGDMGQFETAIGSYCLEDGFCFYWRIKAYIIAVNDYVVPGLGKYATRLGCRNTIRV